MKINPTNDSSSKEISDRLARGVSSPSNPSGSVESVGATAETEKIQISEASRALNLLNSEPFDAAKVAEIRKAISEGKFNVNAERVADRMIGDAAELIVRIFSGRQNQSS